MSDSRPQLSSKLGALEAALYSAGHPLEMPEVMRALDTHSEKLSKRAVEELSRRVAARRGAFEISTLPGGRAVMRLKEEYGELVKLFAQKPLLTQGPLKTLGYIAYNQPVEQRDVVMQRGTHVYGQLKMLERAGLISRERARDRSTVIRTTSFFADYFGLSANPERARLQIAEMFSTAHIEESADAGDRLADGLSQYPGAPDKRSK